MMIWTTCMEQKRSRGFVGLNLYNNTEQSKDMEVTSTDAVTENENRKRKRWAREDNEEKMLLMGMVEAVKEVAATLRPQKCDKIELALTQLPGMTEDDISLDQILSLRRRFLA
ncbi:hypothetical protein FRX31_004078 [Thalictrum thalictroides]|uniref:Uncharacterized protein n=1 Tax=Thalictrum thalictroides TaxID=46969 RepID=A0A7J6X9B9_THATH|nr:hypothetical protein FRX31_004078 [Thalictrum thalictroides]